MLTSRRVSMVAVLVLAFSAVFAVAAAAAWSYPPPVGTTEVPFVDFSCARCHATNSTDSPGDGSGPHKHFATTTSKCQICHSVHQAPADAPMLLPGATISQSCLVCHDGTGATVGVYTTIAAHDALGEAAVKAEHSTDTTNVVPGGSEDLSGNLACSDCHSPHGANTVEPFLRDSGMSGTASYIGGEGLPVVSDCLLRSNVNTATVGAFPEYGAKWCASCHDERHSDSTVINHSVDADATWGYGDVVSTLYPTSAYNYPWDSTATGMGRTNGAYVMAPADAPDGDGRVETRRAPMCQQCHEDPRDVSQPFWGDYTHRGDPAAGPFEPAPVNPEYVTFPHQTTSTNMLVEAGDDLCMNCHDLTTLP